MSRTTKKHCLDGWSLADRKPWTLRGLKGVGFEYWGRRPCSLWGTGKDTKKMTHTVERAENRELKNELKRINEHFDNISSDQLLHNLRKCGMEI